MEFTAVNPVFLFDPRERFFVFTPKRIRDFSVTTKVRVNTAGNSGGQPITSKVRGAAWANGPPGGDVLLDFYGGERRFRYSSRMQRQTFFNHGRQSLAIGHFCSFQEPCSKRISVKALICAVIAFSVGSRSIELAP
jgi:hypothetical protein